MLAKKCLSPWAPSGWGRKEVSPGTGSPFTKHPVSSCCAPDPSVGVGVTCQWPLRPLLLALEFLVGCQRGNWQGLSASQGFLAEGCGLFCLFPKVVDLMSRPSSCTCRVGPGKLFLLADSFPVPHSVPSGICPRASLLAPGGLLPSLSKFS